MIKIVLVIVLYVISSIHAAGVLPEATIRSRYVLMGENTHWRYDGMSVQCNYSNSSSIIQNGDIRMFTFPGEYDYQCQEPETLQQIELPNSSFRVVTTQHKITICHNCEDQISINNGDVVYWSIVNSYNCSNNSLLLVDQSNNVLETYVYSETSGLHEGFHFNQNGVYYLKCTVVTTNKSLLTIVVTSTQLTPHNELIYTHAGVMSVTFGLIIPLGALLISCKAVILHIILQICGQILSTIGLILAIVYNQLNHKGHFDQFHSIIGLVIIIIVVIGQPLLKLLSLKRQLNYKANMWHRRLGLAVIFFALSNVFLGMMILAATPIYIKIFYGVWVVCVVTIYVSIGGFIGSKDDTNNSNGFITWKSIGDKISLSTNHIETPATTGPSKLTKELIHQNSFIQIRKKSVDVLDTPFKSTRQRKVSNVHFGPVVAEQLSAPATPITPNNIGQSNFGFGEKSDKYADESDDSNDIGDDDTDTDTDNDNTTDTVNGREMTSDKITHSIESLSSLPSNGGSIRITRHSSRAHTKVTEIFQRSNSFSKPNQLPLTPSISVNTETPLLSPEYPNYTPAPANTDILATPVSDDEQPLKRCPFKRSPNSDSALPLHQGRQRRTGLEMTIPADPQPEGLSIGRLTPNRSTTTPIRSPSRSPSFSRKRREMLVDNTLRSVMQMSDDAIISANAQGEIVFWSNGAMKIFGYTPKEAIGSSLQMIMPQRFKERHQNGVNKRTEYALDYIKKHNAAPDEQKHARLYAVHGVSKSGREFGVEVVVTSFVVEGDIYYTGIITETDRGLSRHLSASSLNSEVEIKEKQQKAIAIGTQMKIAHKLYSAEYMKKHELQNILQHSLKASEFEVSEDDVSKMVDGIIQASDPDETGVVRFTDLIDLLAKHRLYISDSGIIAKYGKSKAEGNLNARQRVSNKIANAVMSNESSLIWTGLYLLLSAAILLGGILSSNHTGWERIAYGSGSLLSFNLILILLTSLKGFTQSLKGSMFFVRALPLNHLHKYHVAFVIVMLILSIAHTMMHFCSFAFDKRSNTTSSTMDNFIDNIKSSLNPVVTGFIMYCVIMMTIVFSFPVLRKLCHFICFYSTHWVTTIILYTILIVHSNDHFNSSFWKWLLPAAVVFILDRIYLLFVLKLKAINIDKAHVYDEASRSIYIEIQKPKLFKFIPGQRIELNIPSIGYFNQQLCAISSSNKEDKLKLYIPYTGNNWLKNCYNHFKANPHNLKPKEGAADVVHAPIKAFMSQPFGCGVNRLFNYQVAMLVCGSDGPNVSRSIIQTYLEYRRSSTCHCGCHPTLSKLYFIWVIPSGNDYEWFTDFLSDIIEDKHIQRYLDIRIYLTNINSPPDELASALLQLALKTGGPSLSVKRPSQPQLSKLHSNTSYGNPDFESLLDFVSMQQGTSSEQDRVECGVFTVGTLPYSVKSNLQKYCKICSKKKGPTKSAEIDANSPYKRMRSTSLSDDNKSPSPLTDQPPKEWHINFNYESLNL